MATLKYDATEFTPEAVGVIPEGHDPRTPLKVGKALVYFRPGVGYACGDSGLVFGDWLVTANGVTEVLKAADYKARFEPKGKA